MKYIIDTDPGIDDAIAILMAHKYNLDVIGYTVATGNIEAFKAEANIKTILDVLESNAKVYKGTSINQCNHETAEYAHGKDGLGYVVFPKSLRKTEKMSAEDFIIKASKKYGDNLTVICFGSLTNLANAIKKDRMLVKRLKHLVIMGATYNPLSNDDYYEFNISVDPVASKFVFDAGFSDVKVVTHEIGVRSFIEKDYVENLKHSDDKISRFLAMIAGKYIEFSYEHYGTVGLGTPDPSTIASIIDKDLIKYLPCKIDIVLDGERRGACDVTILDESNIMIAYDFDIERFRDIFKKAFK